MASWLESDSEGDARSKALLTGLFCHFSGLVGTATDEELGAMADELGFAGIEVEVLHIIRHCKRSREIASGKGSWETDSPLGD